MCGLLKQPTTTVAMQQQLNRIFALALVSLLCVTPGAQGQPAIIELNSTTFKQYIDNGVFDAIVDVRTTTEWNDGHIEGAMLIENLASFDSASSTAIGTPADLRGCEYCDIAVYCRSGARAGGAIRILSDAGFMGNLYNGQGVSQWTDEGYALVGPEVASVTPPCTVDADVTEQCFQNWLDYTGNSVAADGNATSVPTDVACESATTCDECLSSGCAWADIEQCLDSCSLIADVGCYSSEFFEGTSSEICAVAAADKSDMVLCRGIETDCAACTSTLKSDLTPCAWYDDGKEAWCDTGCFDFLGNCSSLECNSTTSSPVASDPAPAPVNNFGPSTWDDPTAAPVSTTYSTDADCELYSACVARNLTGLCCPSKSFLCFFTPWSSSFGPSHNAFFSFLA